MSDGRSSFERYAELPVRTRLFLESLENEEKLKQLERVITLYGNLRVEVREFLYSADVETLKWLKNARKDEIALLKEAIDLVRSSKVVGRFLKLLLITAGSAFGAAWAFGDYVAQLLRSGIHPK